MSEHSWWEKVQSLVRVARFKPLTTIAIVVLSLVAALLEAVGLSYLIPIIKLAQGESASTDGAVLTFFENVYNALGVPFTFAFLLGGVAVVIVVRYTVSFTVGWLRAILRTEYVRHLQTEAFENALHARVSYFDSQGSDEILNAIVTQATYASSVIHKITTILEQVLLSLVYFTIAMVLAPRLTMISFGILGVVAVVVRSQVERGYSVGQRIADANERVQSVSQAGTQGIRDVKLFTLTSELRAKFSDAINQYASATIRKRRNETAMSEFYQMGTAITVFAMIYLAVTFADLSIASLGAFLFAIFRLSPRVSTLNNKTYGLLSDLPHLTRTQEFIDELDRKRELPGGETPPSRIRSITFDDVSFSYGDEQVLENVSFSVQGDEFVAFVGQSGAGKSTIVSLLARFYEPDTGEILAGDEPIHKFDLDAWRSQISVIRQQPFIFNETLRFNITVGDRSATQEEVERVCEIAQVTEFVNELPNGFDTVLGDDGVRLSGGQRQRIAIARALLKDADLLVFDEATSDLDTSLEQRVHKAIEAMERDCMLVTIAHRLSTVRNANCIHVMDSGRIIDSGTHTELLEASGTYADLYSRQTREV